MICDQENRCWNLVFDQQRRRGSQKVSEPVIKSEYDRICRQLSLRIACRHILVERNYVVVLLQIGQLFRESLIMDMETFGIMSQRSRTFRYAVIAEEGHARAIPPRGESRHARVYNMAKSNFFIEASSYERM